MNADIVYILCPYLDLGSMFCFAAAYPKWSTAVHDYLKKNFRRFMLKVEAEPMFIDWSSFFPGMQCSALARVMVMTDPLHWKELHWSAWKFVPFDVLTVSSVEIIHPHKEESANFPEEVYDLLSKVTTPRLLLKFTGRGVARRVLQTISLQPGSVVTIDDKSEPTDHVPILRRDFLMKCRTLIYDGSYSALYDEFKPMLDADYAVVSLDGSCHLLHHPLWDVVPTFLDDGTARLRDVEGGFEDVLERVVNGNSNPLTCELRRVSIRASKSSSDSSASHIKVHVTVDNIPLNE